MYTERTTLTATASSFALDYEPYSVPRNVVQSTLKDYLYATSVSGQTLYFGSVGGSGSLTDLTYTPYTGKSDLLWAARKWLQSTGQMPYVLRVPGVKAQLTVGDWTFTARYQGARYNSLTITNTGGTLTISGLEPNYPTATYAGYTATELKVLLERDFELGMSPVYVDRWTSTLPTFTRPLTGGADGVFSTESVQQLLDAATIPADCSHVVFLTPITSAYMSSIYDYFLDENVQPHMFLFAAPDYTPTMDLYLFQLNNVLPFRHPMVGLVLGTVRMEFDGREVDRYSVEAAALGLQRADGLNITNIPVPALSFSPSPTEDDLNNLKLGGVMSITRHIGNDISTYEGVNSARVNSFLFSSKVAEIAAVAYKYLYQFLGSNIPDGNSEPIARTLKTLLNTINWVTIDSVTCVIVQSVMYVDILGSLPNEILSINFQIKNLQ
jgi:hypothetical protein